MSDNTYIAGIKFIFSYCFLKVGRTMSRFFIANKRSNNINNKFTHPEHIKQTLLYSSEKFTIHHSLSNN